MAMAGPPSEMFSSISTRLGSRLTGNGTVQAALAATGR